MAAEATPNRGNQSAKLNHPKQMLGFTLVELLIALLLGLLIIAAVGTIFLSSQQSYRVKADLEEAQEAFRFASHTISRLVQSSESIINPLSTDDELFVEIRGGPGIFDCTGAAVPAEDPNDPGVENRVTNAFYLANGSLMCDPNASPGATLAGESLVSRVESISFRYTDRADNEASMRTNYVGSADITIWNNVRSVRTTIRMDTGLEVFFTSTSRGAAIGDSIIVES